MTGLAGIDVSTHLGSERLPGFAREAEERGVTGLFAPESTQDPFISLTLAATSTHRMQLGTGISVAFARTPMSMAYSAYHLHRLSGGRMILGLGSQIKPHIAYRYSMPWSQPADRLLEYVKAVRAIWNSWQTGDVLNFRGDFYTHTFMPKPFSPSPLGFESPPIWLAGVGPRMIDVATATDGLLCHPLTSAAYLRDAIIPRVATHSPQGKPFTVAVMPMVATGRTEEELHDAVAGTRRQIGFYASTPAYKPVLAHHGWSKMHVEAHALTKAARWSELPYLVDDDVLRTFAVVGEPDVVRRELRERFRGLANRVVLAMPYRADDRLALEIAAG
jgi:probable F420-dependent oxidoreductase